MSFFAFQNGLMTQWHRIQDGVFLVTTNAQEREPWCVNRGVPEIIISTLELVKRIQRAKVYAFCILPDHMHIILEPGERGLSAFMKSFKENSSREIRRYRKRSIDALSFLHGNAVPPVVSGDVDVSADDIGVENTATNKPLTIARKYGGGVFTGWQHGFHAQRIAQDDHLKNALRYVERNACRHHLVRSAKDWPWTSLHFGEAIDDQ